MPCAAAMLVLLVSAGTAEAGPADKLPTLAKVQALFPAVTELQVATGGELQLLQDCFSYTVAAHPKKSVSGYYSEPFPIGPGGAPATARVDVFTFKNAHKAHNALKKVAGFVQTCAGSHTSGTTTDVVTSLADPGLADKSLAYQWSSTYVMPPSNFLLSIISLHVVVQRDDRLVDAYYLSHSTPPAIDTIKKLAKLALKSSA
jgi:hypothetical protein